MSFSLLELLRHRRQLPLPELLRLLGGLPRLLAAGPVGKGESLLEAVRVEFVGSGADRPAGEALNQRVEGWPPFILRLERSASGGTDVAGLGGSGVAMRWATARFARLVYELLGGPHRGSEDTYFPPLAALSEAANAVLKATLTQAEATDLAGFWRRFNEVCGAGADPFAWGEDAIEGRSLQIFPSARSSRWAVR